MAIERLKRLPALDDPRWRRALPLIMAGLGVLFAIADHLATGASWSVALVLAAAGPGAVFANEAIDTFRKWPSLAALAVVLLGSAPAQADVIPPTRVAPSDGPMVLAIAVVIGVSFVVALFVGIGLLMRRRARNLDTARRSNLRCEFHAFSRSHSVSLLLFWLPGVLCLTSCADAYATVRATATAGQVAVADFKQWDALHKREILAAHDAECSAAADAKACFTAALAPYLEKQSQLLTATDALGGVIQESLSAANAGTGDPPTIAARLGRAVSIVLKGIADLRAAPPAAIVPSSDLKDGGK
jgi:hypothetical protein